MICCIALPSQLQGAVFGVYEEQCEDRRHELLSRSPDEPEPQNAHRRKAFALSTLHIETSVLDSGSPGSAPRKNQKYLRYFPAKLHGNLAQSHDAVL